MKIMNKKGDVGNTFWLILGGLVAIVVAGLLLFSFFSPKQKALSQETDKLIDITKIDKGLFDIRDLSEKEKAIQTSEKNCGLITNPNSCLNSKLGCFWAKIDQNPPSCYYCLAQQDFFGELRGFCHAYNELFSNILLSDFKKTCEINPCGFQGAKEKCTFISPKLKLGSPPTQPECK